VARAVSHSLVQALRVVPAFASLDEQTLVRIVGASANLVWAEGAVVFEAGSPSDALYIVLSGEVGIYDSAEEGGGEIARIGPGDFFGELSILLYTTHSKTARALEEVELLVLPKESLQELLAANAELGEHFRRKVAERMPTMPSRS
jgi:CRP-like cAMP-binding protein